MTVTKENYEASVAKIEDLIAKEEVLNDQIEEIAAAICEYEEKEFPVEEKEGDAE